MIPTPNHPRGMILFLTLLILGVTATTVILLLSQSSVNGLLSIDEQTKSARVRSEVFGCLDEALAHFAANANYTPTTIDLGTYTCDASVQSSGTQRTLTISHADQGIMRRAVVLMDVGVSPITVSSILEQ